MRATALFLVLFQALFLNVFVPVHTRGAITLGGAGRVEVSAAGEKGGCCAARSGHEPGRRQAPTPQDRKCCAVCYLASTYVPAEPVSHEMALREWIELAHDWAVAQVKRAEFPAPFWPVGPPVVA